MIAKLEKTLSNEKNKDQTQKPQKALRGTLNNESTPTEQPHQNGYHPKTSGVGKLDAFTIAKP